MNPFVSDTHQRLSWWAMEPPREQRRELYNLLYHDSWIQQAHDPGKQNAGSVTAGCDGITMELFDRDEEGNLRKLQEKLRAKVFEPYPVRRVYIPKDTLRPKWRPLGIPSIQDRIVQEALRMVVEPIFEADCSQYSYGFRPTRCTMDAIKCMTWATQESKKFLWVIEGDIAAYFDTIQHWKLVKLLQRRSADKDVIA